MTRAERLAQQEANAVKRLAQARQTKSKLRAERRAAEEKELKQRRYRVGTLVEQHALFTLSDADLARLFAALAPLRNASNPVALLEALMRGVSDSPAVPVEGYADLRSCGPCGASLHTVK
jgi:hypothetical protein